MSQLSKYRSRVSLEFFLWESLGLLHPKVEGPKVKFGGLVASIEQRTRTMIRALL